MTPQHRKRNTIFAYFRLLRPELVVRDPDQLSDEEKQAILSRCLNLAIEGETY